LPHKLLIVPKRVGPRKYKKVLADFEVATGTPNPIEFSIENIGKEIFPGGKIPNGHIHCENIMGISAFTQSLSVTPKKLGIIHPKKTFIIKLEKWFPYYPGLWTMRIRIKPKDNVKIEFYQSREGKPLEGDEWYHFLYAVDRHQLDLILALQQSLGKRR